MHRQVPVPGEVRRPCVFCDETVLQVHGRLATNKITKKTGMAHEHCWANDKMRQRDELSNLAGASGNPSSD